MLSVKNLRLAHGNNVLLDDVSVQLFAGQKIGIIGQNGAGKTSFFKMLLGELQPDMGDFSLTSNINIAYVEQEISDESQNIVKYVLESHPIYANEMYDLKEYYQLEPNAKKLLINLGFSQEELELPLSNFSGGWQMRVNLAKALFKPSDLLLLDEPTNHLDIETVMWLCDWLKSYQGLTLIISHDREFLDDVANHILLFSGKKLTLFGGNYSTFEVTYAMQLEQNQSEISKTQAKIDHLQKFVDRFRAKASKAKQAQSRMKMIEKLTVGASLPKDINYSINFFEPEYQVDKILSITHGRVGYTNKLLLDEVRLDIFSDSRIGLLGRNGIGKSTLIKALISGETLLDGERYLDQKVKIGYFSQNTVDQLDLEDTILGFMQRVHKGQKESYLRGFLGGYGFTNDKVFDKIGILSGGEKARLSIASIILTRPNVLFLDEPTNHLDMQMRKELVVSLQDYVGAVVVVSHDKFLLQSITDEYYLLKDHKLNKFNGDLDDYHKLLLSANKSDTAKVSKAKATTKAIAKVETKQPSNPLKIKADIDKLNTNMERLNTKLVELETSLSKSDLKPDELKELTNKYNETKAKLAQAEEQWLELTHCLSDL